MSLAAQKYAQALLDAAVEDDCCDVVYEQYQAFANEMKTDEQLYQLMSENIVSLQEKKALLERLVQEGLHPYLKNYLTVMLEKERQHEIIPAFEVYEQLYMQYKGILTATAVTAVAMSEKVKNKLLKELEKKYHQQIVLRNEVDTEIIGGMVLYVAGSMIDASIRTKLSHYKKLLKEYKLS